MTLLGAGGAATSILVQAALDGVREISVFCRPGKSTEHARQVINQLTKQTACKINLFDYSDESVIKKRAFDKSYFDKWHKCRHGTRYR